MSEDWIRSELAERTNRATLTPAGLTTAAPDADDSDDDSDDRPAPALQMHIAQPPAPALSVNDWLREGQDLLRTRRAVSLLLGQ